MKDKKIDRRTKKYKQSLGIGDLVEKITTATKIKDVVKWVVGKDCGCDKRQEWLNKKFKYNKNINCMAESEHLWWSDYLKRRDTTKIEMLDVAEILRLFNRIFIANQKVCTSCPGAISTMNKLIDHINNVYESYNEEL
jgi:hypothetical protein